MDLITAKVEAAKLSRTEKKKMYINVDADGECTVADKPKEPITAYANGSEVALESNLEVSTAEPKMKKSKQSNKKVMAEVATKKAPAKKAAAKKEAPKKVAAKVERPSNLVGKATTLFLTPAQWKAFEAKEGGIRDNVAKAVIKQFAL